MSRTLGRGVFGTIHFFLVSFWLPIRKRLGLSETSFKVWLKKFNQPFTCYLTNGSDFAVLREIFFDGEYDIDLENKPRIIFDLGSNVGFAAIYFALKYPGVYIFAFEPDPRNFKKLQKNIVHFSNITPLDYALFKEDKKLDFHISASSMSSSLVAKETSKDMITVQGRSLKSVMNELSVEHVDLIKFDIEGAEYDVFKAFHGFKTVRALVGEVHIDLMEVSLDDFIALFSLFHVDIDQLSLQRYILKAIKHA